MSLRSCGFAFVLLSCPAQVVAQTSNCMAMGGGMLHCDTMGPQGMSSTNCTAMGPTMMTCNTMGLDNAPPAPAPDNGAAAQGIADFISRIGEQSFRKKLGKMIADGDCRGPADYALRKGRIELGGAIRQACAGAVLAAPAAREAEPAADPLLASLRQMVAETKTPLPIDGATTLTGAEAVGHELHLTAVVAGNPATVPETARVKVTTAFCGARAMIPLFQAGATVRTTYLAADGRTIGDVAVTKRVCGL